MKQTWNAKYELIDNNFIGFNLGADFCAEHEWGIKRLQKAFGCYYDPDDFSVMGLDRFHSTLVPPVVSLYNFQRDKIKYTGLYVSSYPYSFSVPRLGRFLPLPTDKCPVGAMWDEGEFLIVVPYPDRDKLKLIEEAINNKNIAIFINSSNNPFENGGLVIAIYDKIPQEISNSFLSSHKEFKELRELVLSTGIEEYLAKHNKKYYALEPKLEDKGDGRVELTFFLNPKEQSRYNFGWFTLEELKEWGEDRGPVIKRLIK